MRGSSSATSLEIRNRDMSNSAVIVTVVNVVAAVVFVVVAVVAVVTMLLRGLYWNQTFTKKECYS